MPQYDSRPQSEAKARVWYESRTQSEKRDIHQRLGSEVEGNYKDWKEGNNGTKSTGTGIYGLHSIQGLYKKRQPITSDQMNSQDFLISQVKKEDQQLLNNTMELRRTAEETQEEKDVFEALVRTRTKRKRDGLVGFTDLLRYKESQEKIGSLLRASFHDVHNRKKEKKEGEAQRSKVEEKLDDFVEKKWSGMDKWRGFEAPKDREDAEDKKFMEKNQRTKKFMEDALGLLEGEKEWQSWSLGRIRKKDRQDRNTPPKRHKPAVTNKEEIRKTDEQPKKTKQGAADKKRIREELTAHSGLGEKGMVMKRSLKHANELARPNVDSILLDEAKMADSHLGRWVKKSVELGSTMMEAAEEINDIDMEDIVESKDKEDDDFQNEKEVGEYLDQLRAEGKMSEKTINSKGRKMPDFLTKEIKEAIAIKLDEAAKPLPERAPTKKVKDMSVAEHEEYVRRLREELLTTSLAPATSSAYSATYNTFNRYYFVVTGRDMLQELQDVEDDDQAITLLLKSFDIKRKAREEMGMPSELADIKMDWANTFKCSLAKVSEIKLNKVFPPKASKKYEVFWRALKRTFDKSKGKEKVPFPAAWVSELSEFCAKVLKIAVPMFKTETGCREFFEKYMDVVVNYRNAIHIITGYYTGRRLKEIRDLICADLQHNQFPCGTDFWKITLSAPTKTQRNGAQNKVVSSLPDIKGLGSTSPFLLMAGWLKMLRKLKYKWEDFELEATTALFPNLIHRTKAGTPVSASNQAMMVRSAIEHILKKMIHPFPNFSMRKGCGKMFMDNQFYALASAVLGHHLNLVECTYAPSSPMDQCMQHFNALKSIFSNLGSKALLFEVEAQFMLRNLSRLNQEEKRAVKKALKEKKKWDWAQCTRSMDSLCRAAHLLKYSDIVGTAPNYCKFVKTKNENGLPLQSFDKKFLELVEYRNSIESSSSYFE